jgi:hypothetical protein
MPANSQMPPTARILIAAVFMCAIGSKIGAQFGMQASVIGGIGCALVGGIGAAYWAKRTGNTF